MMINNTFYYIIHDRKNPLLSYICFILTVGILIAGLWPFGFYPVNMVERIKMGNGITFNHHGIVYSQRPLIIQKTLSQNAACSIELLIRPHHGKNYMSILSLYDHVREQFMFGQFKNEFYIRVPRTAGATDDHKYYREIGIENILEENRTHLITVTSKAESTDIYVDGQLKNSFADFTLIPEDRVLSGYLVLGNSPEGTDTWIGTMFALALYDRNLTKEEVLDRCHEWQMEVKDKNTNSEGDSNRLPAEKLASLLNSANPSPIALYLFDEQKGDTIKDYSGMENDLAVPATFKPLHRVILDVPTRSHWFTRSNLSDVVRNILGFIPFGS